MLRRLSSSVWIFLALLFLINAPIRSLAYYDIGVPSGYINDKINLLSPETKNQLEGELGAFEKNTGNQIAVAIIDSLHGDTVENFANKLFEQYKIGKKGLDSGVLFLVAKNDRQARIEVGYGLEDKLTDIKSANILNKTAIPYFKNEKYEEGIVSAVGAIKQVLSSQKEAGDNPSLTKNASFNFLVLLLIILATIFTNVLSKSKSWWQGGVVGGIAGVIFYLVTSVILVIPALIILGLLFDYILSKYHGGGGGGMWFLPGPWGGWNGPRNGDRDSFGGFGGGRSGGGGASGGW